MKTFLHALTALLLLLTAACGGGGGSADTSADSAAADSTGGGGSEAVAISGQKYAPATLTVSAGSSVTWTNDDEVPHTVTFDDDAVKSSDQLAKGDTFEASFADAGSYAYVCAIHPEMKGSVTVQ